MKVKYLVMAGHLIVIAFELLWGLIKAMGLGAAAVWTQLAKSYTEARVNYATAMNEYKTVAK